MRFEPHVALVTGAASGIGRALVQHLVAVDIVEAPLQALVADLQEQGVKKGTRV